MLSTAVPGAWLVENLEPKATLRAIIDADEWGTFRQHVLTRRNDRFTSAFVARLQVAVTDGRVHPDVLRLASGPPGNGSAANDNDDSTAAVQTVAV